MDLAYVTGPPTSMEDIKAYLVDHGHEVQFATQMTTNPKFLVDDKWRDLNTSFISESDLVVAVAGWEDLPMSRSDISTGIKLGKPLYACSLDMLGVAAFGPLETLPPEFEDQLVLEGIS